MEVLVTEGRVKVQPEDHESRAGALSRAAGADPSPISGRLPQEFFVSAGERASVPLAAAAVPPSAAVVTQATSEEIHEALDWQAPRLQFHETPLAEAVAEFNHHNRHQLVIGDAELGTLPIGGTFRPDNVEGFVRLLSTTLDIRAERNGGDETVLRRSR